MDQNPDRATLLHEREKVVERAQSLIRRAQVAQEAARTQVSPETRRDLRALRQAQIQLAQIAEQERIRGNLETGTVRHLSRITSRLQALGRRHPELSDDLQASIAELDRAISDLRGYILGLGAPASDARGAPTAEWLGSSRLAWPAKRRQM